MSKIIDFIKKHKESILYLIAGGLTTVINAAVQWLFKDIIPLSAFLATAIAELTSITFAFFANKFIVFEKKEKQGIFKEIAMFYPSRLVTSALKSGAMALFVDILGLHYWTVYIIATVVVLILNYVLSKFIIFKKDKQ